MPRPENLSDIRDILFVGGAETFDGMYQNRKLLLNYLDGETKKALFINTTSGDAAGFDVAISDIDGTGKPTIFLSITLCRFQR